MCKVKLVQSTRSNSSTGKSSTSYSKGRDSYVSVLFPTFVMRYEISPQLTENTVVYFIIFLKYTMYISAIAEDLDYSDFLSQSLKDILAMLVLKKSVAKC